jgi:SAM-dependent methyltransferase
MTGNEGDVEALNDRLARDYPIDDYYARSPFPVRLIERRRLEIIRAFVGHARGAELAEIGSGGGHVLRMFPEARITAFDVSTVFLETAKKNLTGYDARFIKGEVDKLDLPAESFDRIICTEVLEHAHNPEAILATMARLLRPNGVAVITVPNDALIFRLTALVRRTPLRWVLGDRMEWGRDDFHVHQWSPSEFERLLGRFFRVTDRRAAPHDLLPIRACFRCVRRN